MDFKLLLLVCDKIWMIWRTENWILISLYCMHRTKGNKRKSRVHVHGKYQDLCRKEASGTPAIIQSRYVHIISFENLSKSMRNERSANGF